MNRWGRIGALFLIVGGSLEAGALGVGSAISPPAGTLLGASLLTGYAFGSVCVGLGLIASGLSLAGRGHAALKIAGVLALIAPVVDAVQGATDAPLGPGPSLAAHFLYVAAVVVAAGLLLTNTRLHGAVRWSVAIPAICFVLSVVAYVPGIVALPWLGTAAAGALLLRSQRQPRTSTACLSHT